MSAFAKASTPQRGYHSMRFRVDAQPLHAAPHHSASLNGLEVVLRHVIGDFPAQGLRLYVSSAEMQAGPDAGVDDLLEGIREPVEVAGFTRKTAARHAESDLVRAEEHL